MKAARGELSNSKITQAPAIAALSGRFITFEEAATNFTDKIANSNFIAFPQGVSAADLDADTTDRDRPLLIAWAGGVSATTAADWLDFGANDWIVSVCGVPVVDTNVTMTTSHTSNGDALYSSGISAYLGANTGSDYAKMDIHNQRVRFWYGNGNRAIATPWNDDWTDLEDGKHYTFLAVKRGNELLHFGHKEGDATGTLLGRTDVTNALANVTDFNTRWNAFKVDTAFGCGHGAYGASSTRCRVVGVYAGCDSSGNNCTPEKWQRDTDEALCGLVQYPAWPNTTESGFPGTTITQPNEAYLVQDSATSYQLPGSATPIPGKNTSGGGAVDHPTKYSSIAALEFPNGAPNNTRLKNLAAYITIRAVDGDRVIDPGIIYNV